jgi:hypothetical protein
MYSGNPQHRDPTQILSALAGLAKSSLDFLDALSSKFAENYFSSIIQTFLNSPVPNIPNLKCTLHSCPRILSRDQLNLNKSLCEFILKLGFIQKSCLDHSTLISTLRKLTHLSSITRLLDCTHITNTLSFPALIEELATPFPQRDSHSWKESLANELLRDAHLKYDNIINTVGFVCRDLEQRCQTVESPLRKAEMEITARNEHIENITRENVRLEEICTGFMKEIEETKLEKESLAHELRCAKVEIEGCQGELCTVAAEKERILLGFETARGTWKEREEELMMTNRILDDELKETQGTVKQLEENVR